MFFLNSMKFLFYSISKQYIKLGETDIPGLYALGIISILQTLNIMTVWILVLIFKFIKLENIDGYYFYILSLILLLFNYLFIFRRKNHILEEKYKFPKKIRTTAFTYAIGTIILFLIAFVVRLIQP